jgi:hypothetical protein
VHVIATDLNRRAVLRVDPLHARQITRP